MVDTWRGIFRDGYILLERGASPAGRRWLLLEGTVEIFWRVELLSRFLGEEGLRVEAEKLLL